MHLLGHYVPKAHLLKYVTRTLAVVTFFIIYLSLRHPLFYENHTMSKMHPKEVANLKEFAEAHCSIKLEDTVKETFVFCPPKQSFTRFAVISATARHRSHYGYLFYLPLTARAWSRIGYGMLVILIGTYSEWTSDPVRCHVLHALVREKVGIAFLRSPHSNNDVVLSQTSRLFGSHIFQQSFPKGSSPILLTTDADLWPLQREDYEWSEDRILSLNAYCCKQFTYKGRRVTMLPMSNIAMASTTWRHLLPLHINTTITATDILNYLSSFFGKSFTTRPVRKGSADWFLDQKLISIKLDELIKQKGKSAVLKRGKTAAERLDRLQKMPVNFRHLPKTLKGLKDAHLLLFPYLKEGEWSSVKQLLVLMYGSSKEEWTIYYEGFRKAFNASKV